MACGDRPWVRPRRSLKTVPIKYWLLGAGARSWSSGRQHHEHTCLAMFLNRRLRCLRRPSMLQPMHVAVFADIFEEQDEAWLSRQGE
jgi:hypothetical protein